ncbi:MAG: hypothetical protein IPK32_23035 [Verrucomicrobiaceae bacterium]|nr:hypothetical protein [Verrucomicrobiaceae bacterium]
MNDHDLNRMLKRAATAGAGMAHVPGELQGGIMERVRRDEGRAQRWRSWVRGLIIAAVVAGVVTACAVGYLLAAQDTTHTTPPVMKLFREGLAK